MSGISCDASKRRLFNVSVNVKVKIFMNKSQELLFELLLVCTGAKNSLRQSYTEKEWSDALEIAINQVISGVLVTVFDVLKEHDAGSLPSRHLMLEWMGLSQLQELDTAKLTKAGETAIKYFRENGFACQILKGSSVGRYYPHPLKRASGDVDVWLDGSRKKIYDFARNFDKDGKLYGVNYQHIHFHLIEGVHIEVHIWPSYLSNPLHNHRLHKFCNMYRPTMESDKTSPAFDRVLILLHCYQHFCGHGVGLRQIMDYFYVLKQGFTEEERRDSAKWIKKLGMKRFAEGLMWVLQQYFGLEKQYMLFEPNEKEGRFIIQEVLQTGNMGHCETRNWGSLETPVSRFFYNLRRDMYFATHYPHEALWKPFFSLCVYAWRLSLGRMKDE